MRPVRRPLILLAAAASAVAAVALAAPADADARPRISGFTVRDQGPVIRMSVNYCDDTADVADSYSSTFRLWDENGSSPVVVSQHRVLGRIYDRCVCGEATVTIPDAFAEGLYSADVAVTNRATGLTRTRVRPLRIR